MEKEEINIKDLKLESECVACNHDTWPVTAWCPVGCGIPLVLMEENIYYCARCNGDFEITSLKEPRGTKK